MRREFGHTDNRWTQAHRKDQAGTGREGGYLQAGREASGETEPANT